MAATVASSPFTPAPKSSIAVLLPRNSTLHEPSTTGQDRPTTLTPPSDDDWLKAASGAGFFGQQPRVTAQKTTD